MENAPWSVCSVFDDPDDSYWALVTIFKDIETVTGTHREDSEDKKPVSFLGHASDTPPDESAV